MKKTNFNSIVILADKVSKGELSNSNPLVQKASKIIANLATTDSGRMEIAQLVATYVEDNYNKYDPSPLFFETKHFNLGDEPLFKTHKKGIVAYETALYGYVPKSRNYETEFSMTFTSLGTRPECLLEDLKTGRLDSLTTLIKDAYEAMETLRLGMIWKLLAQTYNSTRNVSNYAPTNTVNKETLDKGINYIRKKTGTKPTIVADYDMLTVIETFEGFKALEPVYNEIRTSGLLGMYRGCELVYLPEIIDPVSHKSIVPTNKIMICGKKIGYAATKGDINFEQEKDIDDMSWSCRIDKRVGFAVTKPEGIFVIEKTA